MSRRVPRVFSPQTRIRYRVYLSKINTTAPNLQHRLLFAKPEATKTTAEQVFTYQVFALSGRIILSSSRLACIRVRLSRVEAGRSVKDPLVIPGLTRLQSSVKSSTTWNSTVSTVTPISTFRSLLPMISSSGLSGEDRGVV